MQQTLFVNLSTGSLSWQETDRQQWEKYLGSRGYAARLLFDMTDKDTDPLSEGNPLIFSAGPLTGSPWPTAARYSVTTKSPLTGGYGVANASGFFGPEMRKAGIDAIVITGKSARPVALLIEDKNAKLVDSEFLWGKTTRETEDFFRSEYKGSRVASIGPAGENLVRFAAVINDYHRAAARCGVGTVMGSKKLKAVVVRGTNYYSYSPEFRALAKEKFLEVASSPATEFSRKFGTAGLIDSKNMVGDLPSFNHQEVQFTGGKQVNASSLEKYVKKRKGCFACPIKCSPCSEVQEGEYKCELEGPEYETIDALGPMVGNDNLESIIYANLLCNELGLDTISAGVVIAFAMECWQNGIKIQPEQEALEWGDHRIVNQLLRKIAFREGIGDILAEGTKRASEQIGQGSGKYALHVKGMEIPRQDPRVCKAFGLGHVTANRGGDHMYSLPTIDVAGLKHVAEKYFPDLLPDIMEVTSERYKPEMVKFTEAYNAVVDSLGICKFSTTENYALFPEDLAMAVNHLGYPGMDAATLLEAGERIINLERMFNVRLGFSRKDDKLPERFLTEGATVYNFTEDNGRLVKQGVAQEGLIIELEKMLDQYYALRGWNQLGIPEEQKLRELGLEGLIEYLPG